MRFRRGKDEEEQDDEVREGVPPVYSYLEGAGLRPRRPPEEPVPPAEAEPTPGVESAGEPVAAEPAGDKPRPEPQADSEPEPEPKPEAPAEAQAQPAREPVAPSPPVEERAAEPEPAAPSPPVEERAAEPEPAASPREERRPHRQLAGYSLPLSGTGRSSLVPAPPWHYSGDLLVIEYRVDPSAARAFLPPELGPGDDPGAAAAIFADWQSCSDSGEELLDPIRAQYKEFFIVLSAAYRGEPVTRCPLMWVDQGFSLARGWLQGFPKKPGSIWVTRPATVGRAGPRLAEGGLFGATCSANDRRLAEATLKLTGPSKTGPTVNTPPLVNTRYVPLWDPRGDALFEHVFAGGRDREVSPIWEGDATLRFFEAPSEELALLAPLEVGTGFWFSFGYTVDGGKKLA